MVRFFLLSVFMVFFVTSVSSKTTTDQDIKMMEDMGRSVPKRCYTSPNLEIIFSRACGKVLNNVTRCSFAWTAFTLAFGYKDPNKVTEKDYKLFFDVLPVYSPPNSAVHWSGVKSVVKKLSEYPKVSSSANQVSSGIINGMATDNNVLCWCGNTTAFLDTVNPCPITPVVAFWKAFSFYFANSSVGVTFWIGDGSRKGGAFQNTSFFARIEFPNLQNNGVNKLVVINIRDCNKNNEKCSQGTLKVLENQAARKYGYFGYRCQEVCGNASDEKKIDNLVNGCLKIIKEEQKKGNNY